MPFKHGKDTVVKLDGKDLSAYTNTSNFEKNSDSHDVTCYGKSAHVFNGGLLGGTGSMGGIYMSVSVTGGPRPVIEPLIGTAVTFIRQPEGTGSTKPQDSVSVIVTKYTETNPVADMISWSCDMQFSDVIDSTPQS